MAHAKTITYADLVDRLTDLPSLARLPTPGETTALASSYDRTSKYDAATDKYIGWSANGDGNGIIRREGDEDVFMDVQGPGYISRTWAATAAAGHVKIFLDGATTPAVDLPFKGYFDGQTAPFNRPNLVYIPSDAAHGFDNFTPIPFQKSCKIVGDKRWGSYYQFTYTLFPAGTVVPTFSMSLPSEDTAALDKANTILGQCGEPPVTIPGTKLESESISAEAGKSTLVKELSGAGAITALKVKLDLPKDADAARVLLRQLTISITWDGAPAAAVWSPLGDFFGYVGGADTFQSLPVGLMPDGTFYSYWYMPYGTKAHIEVGNDGPNAVPMTWQVAHAPLADPEHQLRFHAKWHRDAFPPRSDRGVDWTLLTTQGAGRYVGTHLHGWNPRGDWWGEGDDKFFVDGEKFPSSFGTGSEDYFGYAWSSAGHFSRPFHNQILNEDNAGHFDDNRWHIPDAVPFQTSFEASLEKYFLNSRGTIFAAEAFWYLSANGTDPFQPAPLSERVGYWVRPEIYREAGVIEGEDLHADPKPEDPLAPQGMFAYGERMWSNEHQIAWYAKKPGETLSLVVPAQKPGKYELFAHLTKGHNYGVFQMNFNGNDVGAPVDLYSAPTVPMDLMDLGPVVLTDQPSILKFTNKDKNPLAGGYMLGLDYLKLVPAP